MSKLKNIILAIATLSVLMVTSASADSGCKTGKFVGSYVNTLTSPDIWGDGSGVTHTFVFQLNLHSDGIVTEEFTGFPDIIMSSGTGTPSIGSWQCRQDGKLVVTVINSGYVPTYDAALHGIPNTPADLILRFNARATYLFDVIDDNTLTRIQSRIRLYAPAADPTDPQGGTLRPLDTTAVQYKRLVASDADLLAP